MASLLYRALVFWESSISARDLSRLNKLAHNIVKITGLNMKIF